MVLSRPKRRVDFLCQKNIKTGIYIENMSITARHLHLTKMANSYIRAEVFLEIRLNSVDIEIHIFQLQSGKTVWLK